jgi:fatty acid-binding protein DegV
MIKIVTDTTASLTSTEYKDLEITPVPLYIRQGEIMKKECFELSYDDFYKA